MVWLTNGRYNPTPTKPIDKKNWVILNGLLLDGGLVGVSTYVMLKHVFWTSNYVQRLYRKNKK